MIVLVLKNQNGLENKTSYGICNRLNSRATNIVPSLPILDFQGALLGHQMESYSGIFTTTITFCKSINSYSWSFDSRNLLEAIRKQTYR